MQIKKPNFSKKAVLQLNAHPKTAIPTSQRLTPPSKHTGTGW
jgi:hypothetical protein